MVVLIFYVIVFFTGIHLKVVFIFVVVLIFYVIVFFTGIHLKVVFISFLFEVILFFPALLIDQPRLITKMGLHTHPPTHHPQGTFRLVLDVVGG